MVSNFSVTRNSLLELYTLASAFSARTPCYFGPHADARSTASPVRFLQGTLVILGSQTDIAIFVLREVSFNTMLP